MNKRRVGKDVEGGQRRWTKINRVEKQFGKHCCNLLPHHFIQPAFPTLSIQS
jgi:hypothetical protein